MEELCSMEWSNGKKFYELWSCDYRCIDCSHIHLFGVLHSDRGSRHWGSTAADSGLEIRSLWILHIFISYLSSGEEGATLGLLGAIRQLLTWDCASSAPAPICREYQVWVLTLNLAVSLVGSQVPESQLRANTHISIWSGGCRWWGVGSRIRLHHSVEFRIICRVSCVQLGASNK